MTTAINKLPRSTLTFDLSAKVAHIIFSETIQPIELNFHIRTPYDKLAKIYTKCCGHRTKLADMPIYGKNLYKNNLENQKAHDLGTWYVALEIWGLQSLFK